ncbi:hypothetical protein ACWGIB_11690 [Streptomyces xiamenensis]
MTAERKALPAGTEPDRDDPAAQEGEAPGEGKEPRRPATGEPDETPASESGGDDDLDAVLRAVRGDGERVNVENFVFAPGGFATTGQVHGGQHLGHGVGAGAGRDRVVPQDGPIPIEQVDEAVAGFAEPDWFGEALERLDSRVLFLVGEPGTGRRTTALNLLRRRSGSQVMRAVDTDVDLARWRPAPGKARGYLVDGLLTQRALALSAVAMGNLRRELRKKDAWMVIVVSDQASLVRELKRELHVAPLLCTPPPPRRIFDARLLHLVPDQLARDGLLDTLGAESLDELLTPELTPAQVSELVDQLAAAGEQGLDGASVRARLSYLAEEEVPRLLAELRQDADGLAFLLAACVFEGLDHRVIQSEADRLLEKADGQLHEVLPASADSGEGGGQTKPATNPRFVFRRSLEEQLRTIRARCLPPQVRSIASYSYAVEPVHFTRHRQAESVLKHVWREYGQLSGLLIGWLEGVPAESELSEPVGRLLGKAAHWSGGRRALTPARTLAGSERAVNRDIAAHALGVAAQHAVLATEVKHLLTNWSWSGGWQRKLTVAAACGADFGQARPEQALRLLRRLAASTGSDEHALEIRSAVEKSLLRLFGPGNQLLVFQHLAQWAEGTGSETELALSALPHLLWVDRAWWRERLLFDTGVRDRMTTCVRLALDDDELFTQTSRSLVMWCRMADRNERDTASVEVLLSALARDMSRGTLRLFVEIAREENDGIVGGVIAKDALRSWREGRPMAAAGARADEANRTTGSEGGRDHAG